MIETTICAACGKQFDFDPPQSTLEDIVRLERGLSWLDAPIVCEDCDVDEWDDYT